MSTLGSDTTPPPQSAAAPGRVTRALLRWLMRSARVAAVTTIAPRFRIIDLEGDALRDIAWLPGQKIQVAIGAGLSNRTYTPMSWDAASGRTRVLAFLHGDGPGSRWAANARVGEACRLLGPRRSLDLPAADRPVALFGDETSFGLAAALTGAHPAADLVFEVSNVAESRSVLAGIGLGRAITIERRDDDAHLVAIGADLSHHVARGAQFVLTGKAGSIQRISQTLKKNGMASSNVKAKAYWAPGKTGLD